MRPPADGVPRLARDTYRAWITVAVVVPAVIVLSFATGLALALADVGWDQEVVNWTSGLGGGALYFLVYEFLTVRAYARARGDQLRHWVRSTRSERRPGLGNWLRTGGGATTWSSAGAVFALLAVASVSVRADLRGEPAVLISGALLVIASWLIIPITYAVQYLREWTERGGLEFPGEPAPEFAEFAYLALQISTTFSSSDVSITSRAMRRRVSAQSVLAYVFTSVIIALLVSTLLLSVD